MPTEFPISKWIKLSFLNLSIVALYGLLMRYKIAFDFPIVDQKNLLHAHSHFAFAGWISMVLYSGLVAILNREIPFLKLKKYNRLLTANLICAFGMLFSFTVQGYKFFSISFSTLSIVVAVLFAIYYIKDSRLLPADNRSKSWANVGLCLNILSSLGPFTLAYMQATKNVNTDVYLGSVYYYLHFQYNGWFFFAGMALAISLLPKNFPNLKPYFNAFALTVIPNVFLSLLWTKLPFWFYLIIVFTSFVQLIAWFGLFKKGISFFNKKTQIKKQWFTLFFYLVAIAVSLKFVLQSVSVIPSISHLVFGFRPIVIAYIHLVLLGIYSLFIIGYAFKNGYMRTNGIAKIGAFGFLLGVFLNEGILAVQGIASFSYTAIPYTNESLFGAALVLFTSAFIIVLSQRKTSVE